MFFPKLFTWVKDHGKSILTIISIVIAVFGGIQKIRADRWEKESLRLDGKLTEQKADQDRYYGEAAKTRADRRIKEAAEKQVRKDLEARIQKFQKDTVAGKRALAQEKKKTVALPPTELVQAINQYIGDESSLTGAGLFLFTRVGTNRTLERFKDEEFYSTEYYKFEWILADHEAAIDSFNISITECEEAVVDNLFGWEECRETLNTAIAGRAADKKTAKASVWQGRKQGAFWTILVAGGLKLFGVW